MSHIERVYHRTAKLDWTEVVTCPHCQARWKGSVIARGYGADRTTYGFGAESAYENAGIDAFSRAVDAGKAALLRARCPRCHKRGGGLVSLAIKTVLFYAAMVALFTWVSRSLAHGGAWGAGAGPRLLPVFILLALVLIPLTISGTLRSVDRRVRFEPLQEMETRPAPPPAPSPRHAPAPRRAAPSPAPSPAPAPAPAPAPDPDALELDTDSSWNKKG